MFANQAAQRRARSISKPGAFLSILGVGVLLSLFSTVTQSQQVFKVEGIVDSPRLFVGTLTPETRLGFGGWVNFPASQGQIQMDVLRVGNDVGSIAERKKKGLNQDQTPANCSAADEDQKLWARNVVGITIDGTRSVVDGKSRYRWFTGTFTPFQPDAVSSVPENRIPEGGIARVRFRVILGGKENYGKETLLHGLDSDGVPTTGCELIFGDASPSPAGPPKAHSLVPFQFANDFPTPAFLDRGKLGRPSDTIDYYAAVHIAADGKGTPISGDPKHVDGGGVDQYSNGQHHEVYQPGYDYFEGGIRTLDDFKYRYGFKGSKPGQTELVDGVKYFNQGDLGIGRQMSCSKNFDTDETACYVENYGSNDQSPLFDNVGIATEATRQGHEFATVAMVERGKLPFESNNKTFFVVYDKNGSLQTNGAQLDNKEFNEFIPGNCLTCHGGKLEQDKNGKVNGVSAASFLPFNPNSFLYFDDKLQTSPNNNSRGNLEASFKRLNEIVYNTDLFFNAAARTLINGWYGNSILGVPQVAPKSLLPGLSFLPRSTFDDKWIPPDWNANKEDQQLYRQVVAPYCQTCHMNSKNLSFSTAANFRGANPYQAVCTNHSMPNAEMTSKLLWKSNARPQLLDRLNILHGCGWETPNLNASIAVEHLSGKIEEPASGCPAGFPAKSTFDLRIENPFLSKTRPGEVNKIVTGLFLEVVSLTNGNRILFPDGTTGGAGSLLTPIFTTLLPGMVESVPINICLKQKGSSTFEVNVLGTQN